MSAIDGLEFFESEMRTDLRLMESWIERIEHCRAARLRLNELDRELKFLLAREVTEARGRGARLASIAQLLEVSEQRVHQLAQLPEEKR